LTFIVHGPIAALFRADGVAARQNRPAILPRRALSATKNFSQSPSFRWMSTAPSTPFHLIFGSQRGERRPAARRASAGIARPLSSSCNTAAGRLSSRPKGSPPKRAKAALQRLARGCYSLRAVPCR